MVIIPATNRKNALTFSVSKIVKDIYSDLGKKTEILDFRQIPFQDFVREPYQTPPPSLKPYLHKVARAEALTIICPEYNGGIPGLIKHFIDHWIHPESFVYKPVCFIGLGGKFGALTPISQLQSIFLYELSFVFPKRVFIQNVHKTLKDGKIQDKNVHQQLLNQAENFIKFISALKTQSFT